MEFHGIEFNPGNMTITSVYKMDRNWVKGTYKKGSTHIKNRPPHVSLALADTREVKHKL
jgi:hypothetical protein